VHLIFVNFVDSKKEIRYQKRTWLVKIRYPQINLTTIQKHNKYNNHLSKSVLMPRDEMEGNLAWKMASLVVKATREFLILEGDSRSPRP